MHGLPPLHIHRLVLGLLGSLRVGNRFVHNGKPTPAGYARAATESGGTLYFAVPTVGSRVVADQPDAVFFGVDPGLGGYLPARTRCAVQPEHRPPLRIAEFGEPDLAVFANRDVSF